MKMELLVVGVALGWLAVQKLLLAEELGLEQLAAQELDRMQV